MAPLMASLSAPPFLGTTLGLLHNPGTNDRVAPSKEGAWATLVYPVTVAKIENAAPSEASPSLS